MNALPKPLQDAIRPFQPPSMSYADQIWVIEHQARKIAAIGKELDDLLSFDVEKMTHAAGRNGPAEYVDVPADPTLVRDALRWLRDKHEPEFEAKLVEMIEERNREMRDV